MNNLENLVNWKFNESEPIKKQFVDKCAEISRISGANIDPYYYFEKFDNFSGSIAYFADIQTELYAKLKSKYPKLDFGIRGRTKAELNYLEKVIKKLIETPFEIPRIYDEFANKIFVMSVNYSIDGIHIYDGKVHIESDKEEFEIDSDDSFEFEGCISTIVVEDLSDIIIENGEAFIKYIDTKTNLVTKLPLSIAQNYKRSSKEELIPYCYEIRKDVLQFYESKGFERTKTKNYIKRPKESGYESIQDSYYSNEVGLGIETQIKTFDMEKRAKEDPIQGRSAYKPGSKDLNNNSIYRVPKYALTTGRPGTDQPLTYTPAEDVCFKYTFDFSKEEYLKLKVNNFDFEKTFGLSQKDYLILRKYHFNYQNAFGMSKEEYLQKRLTNKIDLTPGDEEK